MPKRTKKTGGETRKRRPRYMSTETLVAAIGTRSIDGISKLAERLKAEHPWGASFLAARLKAQAKPALPPDVPAAILRDQAALDVNADEPIMPETPLMAGHSSRMDMIEKEAGL